MSAMATQITSLTIVYLTAHSGADQRKHQSSFSLAFVLGIHRWIPRTKAQQRGKCFHLMMSSLVDRLRFISLQPHSLTCLISPADCFFQSSFQLTPSIFSLVPVPLNHSEPNRTWTHQYFLSSEPKLFIPIATKVLYIAAGFTVYRLIEELSQIVFWLGQYIL